VLLLKGWPQERLVLLEPLAGRLLLLLPSDPPAQIKKVCCGSVGSTTAAGLQQRKPSQKTTPIEQQLYAVQQQSKEMLPRCGQQRQGMQQPQHAFKLVAVAAVAAAAGTGGVQLRREGARAQQRLAHGSTAVQGVCGCAAAALNDEPQPR
jgi:hypothetical protein